jgi:hypothetical protein
MTNSQAGSPSGLPMYEVFAVRYATRDALRKNHFIGGDPHDGPMPMDARMRASGVWVSIYKKHWL